MTAQQILTAMPILQKVMALKLPVKKAYQIYILFKQLDEMRQFFAQEEKKLITKYGVQIAKDGSIQFDSTEEREAFVAEHAELMEYKMDHLKPIELSFADLGEAELSANDFLQLEGVINFLD